MDGHILVVDPNCRKVTALYHQPTADLQVNNTQVVQDNNYITSDQQGFGTLKKPPSTEGVTSQTAPGNEVKVSPSMTTKVDVSHINHRGKC